MSRAEVRLPDGRVIEITTQARPEHHATPVRTVFAAAHVAFDPGYRAVAHSLERPAHPDELAPHIDWLATARIRRHLDAHGFGVAEAMDTAQRFRIGWANAARLIEACGRLGLRHGFVAGAGADHLVPVRSRTELVDAVVWQARTIQAAGGGVVLLPLPWLVEQRCTATDYVEVYRAIVAELDGPLIVHWLGEMFAPALRGYFPGDSFDRVMALDPGKVRGCKLSLLDAALELRVRRALRPRGQVVFTGDDFHFGALLRGGDPADARAGIAPVEERATFGAQALPLGDFSHALLGVFDAIARPAACALDRLARGDAAGWAGWIEPCERLGQAVFEAPTQHYKAGLSFLAWLDGLQPDFVLADHEQRARDRDHYLRVAELGARARVFGDAELTAARLSAFVRGEVPA